MIQRFTRVGASAPAGVLVAVALAASGAPQAQGEEASSSRRIEEVIVTAERRESTVSDTAISMSAFDSQFLQNFNIRNQEDLQNVTER